MNSISQIVLVSYALRRSDHGEGMFLTYNARARESECMKLFLNSWMRKTNYYTGRKGNIKMLLKEMTHEAVNYIHLAQVKDEWRVSATTVLQFSFAQKEGISLKLKRLLVSQASLCVMEFLTFYSNFHEIVRHCPCDSVLLNQTSWLRHCPTSRRVADSIPDGVTGIFH